MPSPTEDLLLELVHSVASKDRQRIQDAATSARIAGCSDALIRALEALGVPQHAGSASSATTYRPPKELDRALARGLDVALLAERSGGIVPLTATAERHLGVGFRGGMGDAVAQIISASAPDASVRTTLSRAAKSGSAQATVRVGSAQWCICAYTAPDGLRVAVTPQLSSDAHTLQTLATLNHEMANGITALASLASVARHPASSPAFVADSLRRIERTAEDTLNAVQSSRGRGRRSVSEPTPSVDCGPILRDLVANFEAVAQTSGVAVETRINGELRTSATRGDLRSILWNLIKNGIEAVGRGGTVRIGAQAASTHIRIVVDDDGPGMSAEAQKDAFEPYFTTKESGTGLGLPLVKHLVIRLGGELVVESEVGQGTRMVVLLPLVTPSSVREPHTSGVRRRFPFRDLDCLLVGEASRALGRALHGLGAIVHDPLAAQDVDEIHVAFVDTAELDRLGSSHPVWRAEHLVHVGPPTPSTPDGPALESSPTPEDIVACMSELFPFRVLASRR